MKKILLYGIIAAVVVLSSCLRRELEDDFVPLKKQLRLYVTVEEIGNLPPATRATVAAEQGEEDVRNIHLLFFDYSESGAGVFVGDYRVDADDVAVKPGMPVSLDIYADESSPIKYSESYSIIAFANMDAYLGGSVDAFLETLGGKTEKEVMQTPLYLPGITSTSPDNAVAGAIDMHALPMVGRTVKMAEQELLQVSLTRAVARFDLQNMVRANYKVVSVAIHNAAKHSYFILQPEKFTRKHTLGHYYGEDAEDVTITPATPENVENGTAGDVTGGLYVFENFQGATSHPAGSSKITSLVVGLQNYDGATGVSVIPEGATRYYRIPICPEESGQNIMRNNVYKVSLKGVLAEGAADAADAKDGQVEATINNWSLDDEGMVVTDGQSTMAIPSKTIRFGRDGWPKEYEIFTMGPGTLEITQRSLPDGLDAVLDGNKLTVSASTLEGYDVRQGTFVLGYGGLRATITVIQDPEDENFLTLNRSSLPTYPAAGGAGIRDACEDPSADLIQVSASGDWTAEVYNSTSDNHGFRIEVDGERYIEWDSAEPGKGRVPLDFVTTQDNPDTDVRVSFVVFTLNSDASYRQVLVLGQAAKTEIHTLPNVDALGATDIANGKLNFDMARIPISSGSYVPDIALNGNYHVLQIIAGNDWNWELAGTDKTSFNVTRIDDKLMISALDTNLSGTVKNASLMLSRPGAATVIIDLVQHSLSLRIAFANAKQTVSNDGAHTPYEAPSSFTSSTSTLHKMYNPSTKTGDVTDARYGAADFTEFVELNVDITAGIEWVAEITQFSHPESTIAPTHKGFLVKNLGNGIYEKVYSITGIGPGTIKVSFDKIYFPLVHFADAPNIPSVTVTVSDAATGSVSVSKTVTQEPLTARSVGGKSILNSSSVDLTTYVSDYAAGDTYWARTDNATVMAKGYGALNSTNGYNQDYENALTNTAYFGTSGTVKTPMATIDVVHTNWNLRVIEGTLLSNGNWNAEKFGEVNYVHIAMSNGNSHHGSNNWFGLMERWRASYEGWTLWNDAAGAVYNGALTSITNLYSPFLASRAGWTIGSRNGGGRAALHTENNQKRVMNYLLGGPFGTVPSTVTFGKNDGYLMGVTRNNIKTNGEWSNVVEVLHEQTSNDNTTQTGYALMLVDPAQRLIWLGETQAFMGSAGSAGRYNPSTGAITELGTYGDTLNEEVPDNGITADTEKFMKNFAAMIVNGAMYGSHFTDILREDFYPGGAAEASTKPLWILGPRQSDGTYPYVNLNAQ